MCGIVAMVGQREVSKVLIEGLKRLEYRGYDSAGLAVLDKTSKIRLNKVKGKVASLVKSLENSPCEGNIGIAHTRWATHGSPEKKNAHPHIGGDDVAIVHNGIIENYAELYKQLQSQGYTFQSDTDSEVIAALISQELTKNISLVEAVRSSIDKLDGAFALAIFSIQEPDKLIIAKRRSPVVLGLGIGENFVASDISALYLVTQRFIFLEEDDLAIVENEKIIIFDVNGNEVERPERISQQSPDLISKSGYKHFMLKEINEQPKALRETSSFLLEEIDSVNHLFEPSIWKKINSINIVACGTSYHAGLVGKYWIERLAGIPCSVEVASEFRYREVAVTENSLFIVISQSGETADTLAALNASKKFGYKWILAICNVIESSLMREADAALLTKAGPEIGVASTKSFTTQLLALLIFAAKLGSEQKTKKNVIENLYLDINILPGVIENILSLNEKVASIAESFVSTEGCLFLGRGQMYPIALEGALKLKEISYIHAEAYPAGELKHGPLALVDEKMPVIVLAPNDGLLEKLKSNISEVQARGGLFFIFTDADDIHDVCPAGEVIKVPKMPDLLTPIGYTIPLQLLAYHVAVLRGTDVDQPRNLAKSVTVE
ncbi:MAG: glutamine--fructose-6-phosphate transaminase (isomerizing) [Pseudomonadota bacterium]|nr:glutamine--fructose-6-phosphate transaminase (isomerizing) [Pseudomonadota bacterium]